MSAGVGFGGSKDDEGQPCTVFGLVGVTVRTVARSTGWRSPPVAPQIRRCPRGGRVYTGSRRRRGWAGERIPALTCRRRTLVFDEEADIRKYVRARAPARRPISAGRNGRASAAACSPSPSTTRTGVRDELRPGRPDERSFLSLFKGVDRGPRRRRRRAIVLHADAPASAATRARPSPRAIDSLRNWASPRSNRAPLVTPTA